MILYHGSKEVVEYPEIRKARFNKDFYFGFYCTNIEKQAERWKDFKSCFLGIGKIQVSNASNQFSYNFSTGYIEICRK